MRLDKVFWKLCIGLTAFAVAQSGLAQAYPSKPIRVIVPFAAGGSNDLIARALQQPLGKALNGTIVVENMPGASTKIGVTEVMKAAPDGHTLLLASLASTMAYYYSGAFDSKVWQELVILGRSGQMAWGMLETRADAPFKDWKELVAYAKKNPGKLSAGGPAVGGMMNLIVLETAKSANIDVTYVPFKGGGPSGAALLGGHVQYRVAQPTEVVTNMRAGKTRGLAVAFPTRLPEMPDVPTFRELGIKFDVPVFGFDLWGPPKLPAPIASKLTKALQQAIKDPAYIEFVKKLTYQPVFLGPDGLKKMAKAFETEIGPKLEAAFPPPKK